MMAGRAIFMMAIVILAACSPEASAPRPVTPELVIAADFPTGAFGSDGVSATQAVQFAVVQQRTIGPFQLSFRSFDDSLAGWPDYAKGVANVKSMAADPAILGMIGPFNSIVAAAEIPVASTSSLVMVSPSTTSDCLTRRLASCQPPPRPGGTNNFFRIAALDSDQARAMAAFALNRLSVAKVAVLSDGFAYGEQLANTFANQIRSIGGTVVLREQIQPSTDDFSVLLARIKADGGQAIYFGGSAINAICRVRRQMAAMLPRTYFLGGDGMVNQACISDAADAATDRMIATMPLGNPSTDPAAERIVADYKASGYKVSAYTFAAYDCAEILIGAIRRAIEANGGKLPSRQQVIDAVKATDFHGLTGRWSFDASGDATSPGISFYRVEAGTWRYWQSPSLGR